MSFENLNLIRPIQSALVNSGYTVPTSIQQQAIPLILEGKDILGCAQTGTGKTAAFAVPILQILSEEKETVQSDKNPGSSIGSLRRSRERVIKALVLTPTRELAAQIGESFKEYGKYTKLKTAVIYGGVSQNFQTKKLREGADILVATPGRLIDLINQKYINLKNIKIFVLDEADRMLDMGFIDDIKKIMAKLPSEKQSLFFSATMPPEIVRFAETILTDPVKIEVTPEVITVEAIKQAVYFVSKSDKKRLLVHILKNEEVPSALVFTRTKRGADNITQFLNNAQIQADAIHSNKSQNARQRALNNFKSRRTKVLVATDIAARGIDIEKLSHVFNFDIPDYSENYIHRIGRTGRAGLGGTALSFCDVEEKYFLKEINKLIKTPIPVISDHPFKINEVDNFFIDQALGKFTVSKKPGAFSFRKNSRSSWRRNRRRI